MRCLRIVLDFVADETSPRAKDELRGYLKAMVQHRNLGMGLGSRALESLGCAGARLLEATWLEAPSRGERVESGGQRVEEGGDPALRRGGTSGDPTDGYERKEVTTV
jgi:hypothetical protein